MYICLALKSHDILKCVEKFSFKDDIDKKQYLQAVLPNVEPYFSHGSNYFLFKLDSKITILIVPLLPTVLAVPPSVATQLLSSGSTALHLLWSYCTATL